MRSSSSHHFLMRTKKREEKHWTWTSTLSTCGSGEAPLSSSRNVNVKHSISLLTQTRQCWVKKTVEEFVAGWRAFFLVSFLIVNYVIMQITLFYRMNKPLHSYSRVDFFWFHAKHFPKWFFTLSSFGMPLSLWSIVFLISRIFRIFVSSFPRKFHFLFVHLQINQIYSLFFL